MYTDTTGMYKKALAVNVFIGNQVSVNRCWKCLEITVGNLVLGCLEKGDLRVLSSHHLKMLKFFKVSKMSTW